jgi:hypothetical protein
MLEFTNTLGAAVEISYGWASVCPYTAFGMGTGAALRLSFSYRVLQGKTARGAVQRAAKETAQGTSSGSSSGSSSGPSSGPSGPSFDLLVSPLILWAGELGSLDSSIPRLGVEGGALITYGSIAAGLSLRWDYLPDAENPNPGPLASALELKIMPSNFVFSVMGGYWYWKENSGAFFGISMGVLY